jgi:hypothetical protein
MRHRTAFRPLGLAVLALVLAPAFASPAHAAQQGTWLVESRLSNKAGAWLAASKATACLLLPAGFCSPASGELSTTKHGCLVDPSGVPRCEPSGLSQSGDNGCSTTPSGDEPCSRADVGKSDADNG